MRFACRIPKARIQIHIPIIFTTSCFSTATIVTRTRFSVTSHVDCRVNFPKKRNYLMFGVMGCELLSAHNRRPICLLHSSSHCIITQSFWSGSRGIDEERPSTHILVDWRSGIARLGTGTSMCVGND